MDSLINKTGKMRSLIRDLETKYDDPAAKSYLPQSLSKIVHLFHLNRSAAGGNAGVQPKIFR